MKMKYGQDSQGHPPSAARTLEQLSRLRVLLDRVKTQAGMGELTAALMRTIAERQIAYEAVRRNRKTEMVFAARVTPDDIRELLPLVKHPVPYSLWRLFLERNNYIPSLNGHETELQFCNSEEILAARGQAQITGRIYRSGIPDPEGMADAIKQAASERAVVDYLGVPFRPNPYGWVNLYLGEKSVEIRRVEDGDEYVVYSAPAAFGHDITVVVLPITTTRTIRLLGWIDLERFENFRRSVSRNGADMCGVPLEALLPMEALKAIAEQASTTMRH